MDIKKRFVIFISALLIVVCSFFILEMILEGYHWKELVDLLHGKDKDYSNTLTMLSAISRGYFNVVAMLLTASAVAIPFLGTIYTPKLIRIFLRDPINYSMLIFWILSSAHIVFVIYITTPTHYPALLVSITTITSILGWISLIPYFFYIIQFLDPSNILYRLKKQLIRQMGKKYQNKNFVSQKKVIVRQINDISSIFFRVIERGERILIAKYLEFTKDILAYYAERKKHMKNPWFVVEQELFFVGFSKEARKNLTKNRSWLEYYTLSQIFIAYKMALTKAPDVVSLISKTNRLIAIHAMEYNDIPVVILCIRYFNSYINEAIKGKNIRVLYDVSYQYRILAIKLSGDKIILHIFSYFFYYFNLLNEAKLVFGAQIIVFDLYYIIMESYTQKSEFRDILLNKFLELDHLEESLGIAISKTVIMLGGYFIKNNFEQESEKLRAYLNTFPKKLIRSAYKEIMAIDESSFFEITNRNTYFEWVPFEDRPYLKNFLDGIVR